MSFYLDIQESSPISEDFNFDGDFLVKGLDKATSNLTAAELDGDNNISFSLSSSEDGNSDVLETSKLSSTSTQSGQSKDDLFNLSPEREQEKFEKAFDLYYQSSSANVQGNYDRYVGKGLKLISQIPQKKLNNERLINKISKETEKKLAAVKEQNPNKKLLVLDLDETLIHSDVDFLLNQNKVKYDQILHFDSDEETNVPLPIILRPGLHEFLSYARENFILVVYTAGYKEYADAILDFIEKDQQYFSLRLYRHHCIFINPGLYVKNLRVFEKQFSMEDVIIVDNSIYSFAAQLNNGILVNSFYDNKEDEDLFNLTNYLEIIKQEKNITEFNESNFRFKNLLEDIIAHNKLGD